MRIDFEIEQFPLETKDHRLITDTEGFIRVTMGSSKLFEASELLLVELAIFMQGWLQLKAQKCGDFYYRSMDFEEEPILAFLYAPGEGLYRFQSVWSLSPGACISLEDVASAFREYVDRLSVEVYQRCGADLAQRMQEVIDSW